MEADAARQSIRGLYDTPLSKLGISAHKWLPHAVVARATSRASLGVYFASWKITPSV
jgi:hypothetical protein